MNREGGGQPLWVFRLTTGVAARLAPLSLVLFVGSVAVYAVLARRTLAGAQIPLIATIVALVGVFVLHEALHAIGFLIFGGRPKFGAGIRGAIPYLYATCPHKRFSWGKTLVIGALPLVVIDLVAASCSGSPALVVPAMVAFAFNTAGAVGDLWLIGVILQTPRTALFEDSDEPAMIAWPGPGTRGSSSHPHGLDPKGFESTVVWGSVGSGLFLVSFAVLGFIEVALARSSANGTLSLGGFVLASTTTKGSHISAQVSILPEALAALVLAVALTAGLKALSRLRRGPSLRA